MAKKPYCTQNNGDCKTCSLGSYGLDCQNNLVGRGGPGRGQGPRKQAPADATRRNILMTDTEETVVRELLKKMRSEKDD